MPSIAGSKGAIKDKKALIALRKDKHKAEKVAEVQKPEQKGGKEQ